MIHCYVNVLIWTSGYISLYLQPSQQIPLYMLEQYDSPLTFSVCLPCLTGCFLFLYQYFLVLHHCPSWFCTTASCSCTTVLPVYLMVTLWSLPWRTETFESESKKVFPVFSYVGHSVTDTAKLTRFSHEFHFSSILTVYTYCDGCFCSLKYMQRNSHRFIFPFPQFQRQICFYCDV